MAGDHAHANFKRVVNPMKKLGLLFLFLFASNALAAYSPGVFIADPTTPANQAKVTASTPLSTDKALACVLHPNSASIAVTGTFWQATQPVSLSSIPSLSAGSNVIGKVSIDQTTPGTTNGVQINAALPAGSNTIGAVTQAGRTQANAPVYNSYASTSITTSAYTQLIASTSNAVNYLDIFDSSGQAMILATGASGSEVILAYIPPGGEQVSVSIPSGTRIAYKALTANAASGFLLMNLYK